jgi:hypothetical protein
MPRPRVRAVNAFPGDLQAAFQLSAAPVPLLVDGVMMEEEEDIEFHPPPEDRVLRRAWAISSVMCRAFIDSYDDSAEAATLHSRLLSWIDSMDLRSEFEPEELEMVETDLGSLDPRAKVNGTWRSEGLVVLAWALGATAIPRHDEMVDPTEVANSIYFLSDDAMNAAKDLKLRPSEELGVFAEIQYSLHWRIRDFSLRQEAMDFRKFAETAWFGPLRIEGIPLAEDDLAIDGVPIAMASQDRFRQCQSIAMERHQAINWLQGWDEIYSEVDTST